MDKTFDPAAIESTQYQAWEQAGLFKPRGDGETYCIMIPPPNVTGTLHMGHALTMSIQDLLIRHQRMLGKRTLWQPGTDHAGIATQMVVERQLKAESKTKEDLGRKAFLERVWDWKAESGGTIFRQLRRLGASADWSRERFTMDEGLSEAVQKIFIDLYDDGLIYKGTRLVNWDPVLGTALSDLEVNNEEESGKIWHIRYPLSNGKSIVIATTRPETMLGDTGVAVHPDDARYQDLIGTSIVLPLVGREIPIVADEHVDPEFGTGCVKITPAHDFNDYEIGKRHDLPMISILNRDATIADTAPEAFVGMDRFEARKAILAALEAEDLLVKVEDYTLKAPRSERSNTIVEPMLTEQWYVDLTREKLDDGRDGGWTRLIKPALDAVNQGRIKFIPEANAKTYFQWLENIQDWCVSRQIWWGHQIPAWYDEQNNLYVAQSEAAVREKYALQDSVQLRQETDVLDTWFSSALWPFSTLGWPEKTEDLKQFYPTSTLVTGHDIIFFWVARMIMFGLYAMDDAVPFNEVYIHGLVRDAEGKKMSKSKGNVLDPLDIIDGIELDALLQKRTANLLLDKQRQRITAQTEKEFPEGIAAYGTDALRFTVLASITTGRDVNFDTARVAGYRNFCNKLWNATRFVLMSIEGQPVDARADRELTAIDQWIITRLQRIEADTAAHLANYRFDLATKGLYDFFWNEFCDWYLEITKPILNGEHSEAIKAATRGTLLRVLETLLRLLHPFMPFITEALWQRITPSIAQAAQIEGDSIMTQPYPEYDASQVYAEAEAELEWLKSLISAVRKIRSEMNISPSKAVPLLLRGGDQMDRQRIEAHLHVLAPLARLEAHQWLQSDEPAPQSATALVGELEVLIPLAGLIDVSAELQRLDKTLLKINDEAERLSQKLGNANYVDRAPADLVERDRARVAELISQSEKLSAQREEIAASQG